MFPASDDGVAEMLCQPVLQTLSPSCSGPPWDSLILILTLALALTLCLSLSVSLSLSLCLSVSLSVSGLLGLRSHAGTAHRSAKSKSKSL